MKYHVDYTKQARKTLNKMDSQIRDKIYNWINKFLEGCENPRLYGKALTGNFAGNWRYKTGDYRIVADIQDDKIIILVTDVGHRREIYRLNS